MNMKKFVSEATHVMRDILNFKYHKSWASIFNFIFLYIADRDPLDLKKFVADAVIYNVWFELCKDWSLNEAEEDEADEVDKEALLYTLYDNYADRFEERVRQRIEEKVTDHTVFRVFSS